MVQIGFPILDSLTSLLLTMVETAKGYFSLKVAEYNCKMRKLTYEEESKNPIGFMFEEDEEDD